ncbi:hypothetical protein E2C01_072738 [Portunus trituberculatus]|uniref:Uncharacterized protein n=1 Tax=Portunus trituberculatus TaxID=210409 RepID=A0A5B7I3E5_PORTR|nr:hypothetical protein [Portunus trituberculatus]
MAHPPRRAWVAGGHEVIQGNTTPAAATITRSIPRVFGHLDIVSSGETEQTAVRPHQEAPGQPGTTPAEEVGKEWEGEYQEDQSGVWSPD